MLDFIGLIITTALMVLVVNTLTIFIDASRAAKVTLAAIIGVLSAFEGTPLSMARRDCGLISFMICGIATEIGIDPTVRHGADLGFIPIVIEDACGHGHRDAAERSIENMRYMGDAIVTNVPELRQTLGSTPKN
jgi:nicotinamidase-related amidase